MAEAKLPLTVTVDELDADDQRLDDLTTRLLVELSELGAVSVERPAGEVQEGAKGDPYTLGVLVFVAMPAFLPKLVKFLQAWVLRGESRTVKIKTPTSPAVEIAGERELSEAETLALVEKLAKTQASDRLAMKKASERNHPARLRQLRQILATHFDEGELNTLCFDLGVDYDDLPAEGKANKARELVKYLERRDRIPELVRIGRQLRPDISWDDTT